MPELRRIDSGKIACISARGKYSVLPSLFEALNAYLDLRRVSRREERFAIIYDLPAEGNQDDLQLAAGVELTGETMGDGEVIVVTRPSGWLACELHRGAYESMGETRSRLQAWIESQGYRVAGPAYEYFLKGPLPGAPGDPSEVLVEIQWPVEKAGA